jgi:hypothetical protein
MSLRVDPFPFASSEVEKRRRRRVSTSLDTNGLDCRSDR